jgi:F420-0:gamma-glutamyl ligase
VSGDASEGTPVVIIRGLELLGSGSGKELIRNRDQDVFR